jgi:hypothetical protein
MKQQNSRYDGFGHTLNGGPTQRLGMKKDSETIRHSAGTYLGGGRDASRSVAKGPLPRRHFQ